MVAHASRESYASELAVTTTCCCGMLQGLTSTERP